MKKVVYKTAEGEKLEMLKLDGGKLDSILGKPLSEAEMVRLRLEVEKEEAIRNLASAKDIQEIEEL